MSCVVVLVQNAVLLVLTNSHALGPEPRLHVAGNGHRRDCLLCGSFLEDSRSYCGLESLRGVGRVVGSSLVSGHAREHTKANEEMERSPLGTTFRTASRRGVGGRGREGGDGCACGTLTSKSRS